MKEICSKLMLAENYDRGINADHRRGNKKNSKQDSLKTLPGSPPLPPPPPPPPSGASGASGASGTTRASDSAQAPPSPPPSSSTHQGDQSTSTAAPSSSIDSCISLILCFQLEAEVGGNLSLKTRIVHSEPAYNYSSSDLTYANKQLALRTEVDICTTTG
ncbi:hypothetical protein Tco_1254270 [Tanacetum coccineum]